MGKANEIVGTTNNSELGPVAAAMAFAPTPLETAKSESASQKIGFLADFTYTEYTSRLLDGVLNEAEAQGYTVQRFRLSESRPNEEILQRCLAANLAGVIVHDRDFRFQTEHLAEEFHAHKIPYVLVDMYGVEDRATGVSSDDADGMEQAVQHLVDLGHQRILFGGGVEGVGTAIARFPAYEKAMRDRGLDEHIDVMWTHWDEIKLEDTLRQAFMKAKAPTAIICGSDSMALLMIRNFHEMGMRVPRDISIIGFGNLMRTEYASPPLTTITLQYEQMGREAMKMLLENRQESQWKRLPTTLRVRRSTGAPPF